MSLSRREFKKNRATVEFDPAALGEALRSECPEIGFALLMGSARDGIVPARGDLDIAVSIKSGLNLEILKRIEAIVRQCVPDVEVDIGLFNQAEPVYRFEALKGRLLFTRDQEDYLHAFSLTCREYESQMVDYERQARYRLQRKGEAA
jgi:hypothetical protein